MTRIAAQLWVVCLICCLLPQANGADDAAVNVEPAELARRVDLVGREIVVDDRIRYFLESKRGQGFDELILKRTDVPFRLLASARYARPPSESNAIVRATLKIVEGRMIGEVITLTLLGNDGDRLSREVGRLRPDDLVGRRSWARWAERRGRELNDAKLVEKGVALEVEALWAEASRPGADPIALVEAATGRPIPREVREALLYRGLRRAAELATTAVACNDLLRKVRETFPQAVEPTPGPGPSLEASDEPATVYRAASEAERRQLTRRLYADLVEKSVDARLAADPSQAMSLVEEATQQLPDRPQVADRLRQRGLAAAERGVTSMRQAEVEELARTLRAAGQEDRARHALEEWLHDRRKNRLSPSDAEGRVLLAANYEKLLGDRNTAGELLSEADRIDPQSRSVADAFLRLGYRKGDTGWFDPPTSTTQPATQAPTPQSTVAGDSLRGLTRSQARSRMGGKPDRVVRAVTQGMIVEQWVYPIGKVDQIVVFRIDASTSEPRVSANYSLPQSVNRP